MDINDVLIDACKTGNVITFYKALDDGADLHHCGDLPMYYASVNGHYNIVQLLWLRSPRNPVMFHVGVGTLRKAAENGHEHVVKFIMRYATADERLIAARAAFNSGHTSISRALETLPS